ncbi:hypothetical protein ElyMa_005466900 [Elysia marginata]|uniref:Uncharacterized protein n=1 Tax=Elysia marginata TaxID=1093978 RepID=A0AAV4EP78_9GAST|nr:hypothetical protein ElyMa_005466900 [Elysia marginata]
MTHVLTQLSRQCEQETEIHREASQVDVIINCGQDRQRLKVGRIEIKANRETGEDLFQAPQQQQQQQQQQHRLAANDWAQV